MTFLYSPRVQSLRVDFRYHSDNLSINTKTARPVAFYIHTHSTHNMDAQFLVGHLAIYLYTWTRKKRKEIRRCRTDALAFIFSISSLWASPLARWSNLTACLTSGAHSSVPRWVKNQRNERCCCFQMKNNTSSASSLWPHTLCCAASSSAAVRAPAPVQTREFNANFDPPRICIRERVKICVPRVDFLAARHTQYEGRRSRRVKFN